MHGLLDLFAEAISYVIPKLYQTFAATVAALLSIWLILMLTR
jgi:hypothetical protein